MRFNRTTDKDYSVGKRIGYFSMFFIFSIFFFLILRFFEKIPKSWNYLHVLVITIIIISLGKLLGWLLR